MQYSNDNGVLVAVEEIQEPFLIKPTQFSSYTVIFLKEGRGTYYADIGTFSFEAPVLLFATPLQRLAINWEEVGHGFALQFHGDFYCIEYHKPEVACNGLLFNNIYIEPSIRLSEEQRSFFTSRFSEMLTELSSLSPDESVLRSYVQLILAKSSSIKRHSMELFTEADLDRDMEAFRVLLDANYLELHKPSDYARLLAIAPDTLTKKSQKYFGKSPSLMIQERLILEAKKELHLTRKSIKEIAAGLNFNDEFYFSRFFKKFTGVSPQAFRNKAGISIVADIIE